MAGCRIFAASAVLAEICGLGMLIVLSYDNEEVIRKVKGRAHLYVDML